MKEQAPYRKIIETKDGVDILACGHQVATRRNYVPKRPRRRCKECRDAPPVVAETTTKQQTTPAETTQTDLAEKSVILQLRMGRPGNRRRVRTSLIEVDADKDALNVSKELLESPELKAVASLDSEIRRWVSGQALPSGNTLKEGLYRIPIGLIESLDDKLIQFDDMRTGRVNDFLKVYEERVAAAQGRLRALYDEGDYLPGAAVAAAFTFDYRYLAFDVPDALGRISKALMEREQSRAKVDVQNELEDARNAIRELFAGIVDSAVDALGTQEGGKRAGKPKIFKDTLIPNMQEFFATFDAKNDAVGGDAELADLVQQAREAIRGKTPDKLRKDKDIRASTQDALKSIQDVMRKALREKKGRRFDFSDL